jgi:PAS domain S-box-containing protein
VLLIEDSEADAKLVSRLLRRAPVRRFAVTAVDRLQSAIEGLRAHDYDVVLLDLGSADGKGAATLNAVLSECTGIPVVILTATGNEEAALEALENGAQDYLVKGTSDDRSLAKSILCSIKCKRMETDQRHTREKLRESEERFLNIFNNAAIGMVEYDGSHRFIMVNDYACGILGYRREALIGKDVLDIIAPENRELTIKTFEAIHSGRLDTFNYEKRYIRGDGTRLWASITLSAIRDKVGRHMLTVGTIEDISGKKKTEKELRESEEKFSKMFQAMPVGVSLVYAENGAAFDVNDAWLKMTGFSSKEEVIGKTPQELGHIPQSNVQKHIENELGKKGTVRNEEIGFQTRSGEKRTVSLNMDLIELHGVKFLLSTHFDITEHKALELEVLNQRRFLETVLNNLQVAVSVKKGRDLELTYCNPAYQAIYPGRKIIGEKLRALNPDVVNTGAEEMHLKVLDTGEPIRLQRYKAPVPGKPDAVWEGQYVRIEPISKGDEPLVLTFAWDVTEQVKAEAALRESEERFRIMADGAPMIIWVTDQKGGVQFVNRTCVEFFGVTLDQVEGGKWQPLVHPDDADFYVGGFLKAVRERKPFRAEGRVRRADGEWRWVMSYGEPRYSASGEFLGHVGLSPDITDRKRAEEALKKSEYRLEILNESLENLVVQRTEQVRSLSAALTSAEQRERKRFSNILHDTLQQKLLGARILLNEHLSDHQSAGAGQDHEDLDEGIALLNKAIQTARVLALELNPPVLKTEGLDASLRWLSSHMKKNYGLDVALELRGHVDRIKGEVQILITQMIHELLENVTRHSGVSNASVEVSCGSGRITLIVEDKGKGFDYESLMKMPGNESRFGLLGIKGKLDLFGGRLAVESRIGQGTKCSIFYPYSNC